ncbi:MAG: hypothetical protein DMF72_11245 [Acidobacteria bacterium]|nr:MAG: hypothetical protein DMF72_11245 [Acidobacteriota bacterium]
MPTKFCRLLLVALLLASILCALNQTASAQSSDQNLPTAVISNDLNGKIVALDLGDPRLTRHYYAFEADPGDLLFTVESKNLNGDVDVFSAVTFRPLTKTTMYATSQSSEITKGIYLRAHQILILRVEARTPSDEPGTYHIHFGGTFAPFSGRIPVAENSASSETSPDKSDANRLSSVGATIPRPIEETVAAPKPSPAKSAEETTARTTATEKPATTTRRTTSRNPRRGTRRAAPKVAPPKKTESTETQTAGKETKSEEVKPAAVTEKPAEATQPTSEKPKAQEVAPAGAHLVIEEKDGTRIDRPMSTVRRVIVEGGTIVIVLKTGKIERIQMADVAKFAIEPQ